MREAGRLGGREAGRQGGREAGRQEGRTPREKERDFEGEPGRETALQVLVLWSMIKCR